MTHESLIGYPPAFIEQHEKILQRCREDGSEAALLLISIDNLAMVLSGYGHDVTQEVLDGLRDKIASILSEDDVVSYIQRDQIGILLSRADSKEADYINARVSSIVRHFGNESCYGSLHFVCSVVYVPLDGTVENSLKALDKAFIALRHKRGFRSVVGGDSAVESALCRQEMGLANYLNSAINENRLRLAFQPIICSKTGEAAHYEALLRVVSDDGMVSSAGALIPIAERMGFIHILDRLVMEMVVEEVRRFPDIKIAFNLSNITISDAEWLDSFRELVGGYPDIASRLIVEITETAMHRDLSETADFIASVQSIGAQVALDDFGSGYTSFRQLKTLSLDMVKIDGAFINDLADNHDNLFFVKTLMEFTRGFGLRTVAEFVETGEVAKILMDLGVTYMQGYYFAKPVNHRPWIESDGDICGG